MALMILLSLQHIVSYRYTDIPVMLSVLISLVKFFSEISLIFTNGIQTFFSVQHICF